MYAIPSMYKSLYSSADVPKSIAPSVAGTRAASNLPVGVIVSDVALPKFTSPLASNCPDKVVVPVTPNVVDAVTEVKAPVDAVFPPIAVPSIVPPSISAVSATNESIFAVPSI